MIQTFILVVLGPAIKKDDSLVQNRGGHFAKNPLIDLGSKIADGFQKQNPEQIFCGDR